MQYVGNILDGSRDIAGRLLGILAIGLCCAPPLTHAEPHAITPAGLNTVVRDSVTASGHSQYDITGGTRPAGGTTLFHSFSDFNVPRNTIANFSNDAALPTSHIVSRVTGGNPSNILGTIQTTGFGNADLFLMNPAGIVFGPDATLSVGGSVAFTTADYVRLAETNGTAGIFYADPAVPSLLTNAPVAAFGFLGSNPGAITVSGSTLAVTDSADVSLVGGNITIASDPLPNGRVQPARLSAPGGDDSVRRCGHARRI